MDNYEELLTTIEVTLKGYHNLLMTDILPLVMDDLDTIFVDRGVHKLLED